MPPAPAHGVADPYAEAFADRPVEPPDWSQAIFGDEPAEDPLLPPDWLDEPSRHGDDDDDRPTPPMGNPRI